MINKKSNMTPDYNCEAQEIEEPLDLADLDLSRLRLSKKDLETLSNIAPGLPKCYQEQLLAKLPPTQARKLSRTLSVQTGQNCSSVKIYKRSQSSGRTVAANDSFKEVTASGNCSQEKIIEKDDFRNDITKRLDKKVENVSCDTNIASSSSILRSHSRSKSNDDNVKDLGSVYSTDVNDKYKYYSPYVNKVTKDTTQKNNQKICGTETASCTTSLGRPPSGRLSPPTPVTDGSVSVTRRPTQRRISRLLRPDFFDQPLEELPGEPNQTVLCETTDRTVSVSIDKHNIQPTPASSASGAVETQSKLKSTRHVRNKSVELFSESSSNCTLPQEPIKCNRRSVSRSRDLADDTVGKLDLADKILHELQLLSSIRTQQEQSEQSTAKESTEERLLDSSEVVKEKSISTIKKIKKVKTKEKSTESSTDVDTKTTGTVIKKVKKIVKKSETLLTPTAENTPNEFLENTNQTDSSCSPKKVSKLKRPKSYPMKESISSSNTADMCNTSLMAPCKISALNAADNFPEVCSSSATDASNVSNIVGRESRLLRPKSYPSSKLAAPKEVKKVMHNKIATIDETSSSAFCPKSDVGTLPTKAEKSVVNSTPIGESTSTVTKKTIKITKKSKLSQPTASVTPASTASNTTSSTGEDSKESSPAATVQLKEKVCEKKPNKGLLYAIGQKFEKLRASATSHSCANIPVNKKSSPDNSSPEKLSAKSSVVKKTKSLGNSGTKTVPTAASNATAIVDTCKENNVVAESTGKAVKTDKRSRIDTMIRNFRERSVPRSQPTITSESNYIKRAISVEEMPGTFNRKSVNKVLGLFKRYEKDGNPGNRVRNTRSTSNIERQISEASVTSSPIYQNADAIIKLNEKSANINKSGGGLNKLTQNTCKGGVDCKCDILSSKSAMSPNSTCPECIELTETKPNLNFTDSKTTHEGNKERRKGLMLDLIKPDKAQNSNIRLSKTYAGSNDNEIYSNVSPYNRSIQSSSGNGSNSVQTAENVSNNNNASVINNNISNINNNNNTSSMHTSQTSGYRSSSTHEINQNNNLLSPSFENIGTYSSDSRSYQEDCASTSTFLSPTEEPELCFDAWSVCSEDNYRGHGASPSPTVSRLSRASQASSPTRRCGDSSEPSESVVDRITRRSFYCRFNEKKPKRTSSIVGPNAVREYYREQSTTSKSRSSNKVTAVEREHSPDITQEFFRPLKLSPIGTELKPPVYRSSFSNSHDYSLSTGRPRKSLNDIRTPTSPLCLSERRYGSFGTPENELLSNSSVLPTRYKRNTYDETPKATPSSTYYNTYNPKRRFSYTTNGSVPSGGSATNTSAHIEGYATMGRRPIRAYDHRTMSLLDPPSTSSYRHEGSTSVRDYTTSLSRSNSRYRKSSTSRSPTNI